MDMFKRVLIANRGEIAVRVIRACRELGVETVAVYSDADRKALHVTEADMAYGIGAAPSAESYLVIDKIINVARRSGAEAIHPGYGFLSERSAFAQRCAEAGIVFIGPPASAIEKMGDKVEARKLMMSAGVPVVPGSDGTLDSESEVVAGCQRIGFPIMLKAAAGGGGKGMRLVQRAEDLTSALRAVRSEARSSFGDDRLYVERFVDKPRHVEIQVMADRHGNCVHVYERECSVQRRHQKVIEESPSPAVTPQIREEMGRVAVRAAQAVDYVGAGTVEFLVDSQRRFYFLEMNTRIQVEHPITEMVTGIDLVKAQIEVAAGLPLAFRQEDIGQRGHAIECRIYAEDPSQNFMPSPGTVGPIQVPGGPGIRNDGGVHQGYEVSVYYDPIISKLVAWGATREEAIDRMLRALAEYRVQGLVTNLPLHRWVLQHPLFRSGDYDTNFLPQHYSAAPSGDGGPALTAALIAAALDAKRRSLLRQSRPVRAGGHATSNWLATARREAIRG